LGLIGAPAAVLEPNGQGQSVSEGHHWELWSGSFRLQCGQGFSSEQFATKLPCTYCMMCVLPYCQHLFRNTCRPEFQSWQTYLWSR